MYVMLSILFFLTEIQNISGNLPIYLHQDSSKSTLSYTFIISGASLLPSVVVCGVFHSWHIACIQSFGKPLNRMTFYVDR